jgi:hypothetical protein
MQYNSNDQNNSRLNIDSVSQPEQSDQAAPPVINQLYLETALLCAYCGESVSKAATKSGRCQSCNNSLYEPLSLTTHSS